MKQSQSFFRIIVFSVVALQLFHSNLLGQIPEQFTVWKFSSVGVNSSALIIDSVVYFGAQDGLFYALHKETGEEIWRFETERPIYSKPVLYQDIVLVKAACKVFAIDRKSGNEVWSYVASDENPGFGGVTQYDHSSPIVYKDMVYFGDDWGNISGVDPSNGELKFRYTSSQEYTERDDWYIRSTPVIYDDIIYFGDYGAYVYAISLADSSEKWIKEVYHPIHDGSIVSDMVIKDSMLYFGGYNNAFSPLYISNGEAAWTFTDAATFLPSTPIFNANNIIMGATMGSEKIHCLNAEDGSVIWSFQAKGIFFEKPIIVEDTLLVMNSSNPFQGSLGILYLLDVRTGEFINEIHLPRATESSVILNDSTLILGKHDGLYCINYLPYLQPNNVSSIVFVDKDTEVTTSADQAFNFRFSVQNNGLFCDTVSTSNTIEGDPTCSSINFQQLTNFHLSPTQTGTFGFSAKANELVPGEYRINFQVKTPKDEGNFIEQSVLLTITEPSSSFQHKVESSVVKVFPNPFTNSLSFQLPDTEREKSTLRIYSSTGCKVYESTFENSINNGLIRLNESTLEKLGEQMFFYSIQTGNKVFTGKFIRKSIY